MKIWNGRAKEAKRGENTRPPRPSKHVRERQRTVKKKGNLNIGIPALFVFFFFTLLYLPKVVAPRESCY